MFRTSVAVSMGRFTRRSAGRFLAAFLVLGVATAALPAQAASFQSEGRVRDGQGWSGYWWPMLASKGSHLYDTQGAFQPLQKYGLLTGDYRPLEWEKTYKYT